MASKKKVALITGANKGIGRAVASQLGAQGMTVPVGARDAARREEKVDGRFVMIDVTSPSSIESARAQVEREAAARPTPFFSRVRGKWHGRSGEERRIPRGS